MKRFLLVVVVAALVPSFAPALELERLPPGPLPGKPAPGRFSSSVRDVRELIAVGHRYQRTRLLIGRGRSDQLCVAATAGARGRARFTCLASWDHPPLLVRLGAGGGSRAKTNWLSVVGLVRADAATVTVESDRFQNRAVRLQGPPGFPWKAFAIAPSRTDRPFSVRARDAAGAVLQRVDLSWAFRPPCEERGKGCRSRAQRRGRWSEARDPIAAHEAPFIRRGGGARTKQIATDHPAVQQVIAGQPFSFDAAALWRKCNGGLIGGVVSIRLSRPVNFEGDVPVHGYRNGSAYLEGVWHLRVENGAAFARDLPLPSPVSGVSLCGLCKTRMDICSGVSSSAAHCKARGAAGDTPPRRLAASPILHGMPNEDVELVRRPAGALIALTAALLVGCGGSGSQSADEQRVRSVFREFVSSIARPDYEKTCSLLTKSAKASWAGTGRSFAKAAKPGLSRQQRSVLREGCPGTFEVIYGAPGSKSVADTRRKVKNFRIRSVRVEGSSAFVSSSLSAKQAILKKDDRGWKVEMVR